MAETLKQETRSFLANVPEEYVFRSQTCHILHNLKELGDELRTMPNESYAFHANAEKNDFANWVRDIIKDEKLANDLRKSLNQLQAARVVANRISTFSKR